MNLLLITEGENKHYVLIKDFKKFMYDQTKHQQRKHFCMYCLQCFNSNHSLNTHKTSCMVINGEQAIKMQEKEKTFRNSITSINRSQYHLLFMQIWRP